MMIPTLSVHASFMATPSWETHDQSITTKLAKACGNTENEVGRSTGRTIMAASNPLRVGLIGATGRWGPRAHIPALQRLPEIDLYALCTAHADTAQAASDKYGVKRAYGDDKSLNADKQV